MDNNNDNDNSPKIYYLSDAAKTFRDRIEAHEERRRDLRSQRAEPEAQDPHMLSGRLLPQGVSLFSALLSSPARLLFFICASYGFLECVRVVFQIREQVFELKEEFIENVRACTPPEALGIASARLYVDEHEEDLTNWLYNDLSWQIGLPVQAQKDPLLISNIMSNVERGYTFCVDHRKVISHGEIAASALPILSGTLPPITFYYPTFFDASFCWQVNAVVHEAVHTLGYGHLSLEEDWIYAFGTSAQAYCESFAVSPLESPSHSYPQF